MKLVLLSTYMHPHQLPLAQEFVKIYGDDYKFIAVMPTHAVALIRTNNYEMNQESCVLRAYESQENMNLARKLILESEHLITGGVSEDLYRDLFEQRIKDGKIIFQYAERSFKSWGYNRNKIMRLKSILAARFSPLSRHVWRRKYEGSHASPENGQIYLLCASAFASMDNYKLGYYANKAYKWGYFTEYRHYDDIENLISRKESNSILWAGNPLSWRHPDLAVLLAKNLKSRQIPFHLRIIGTGEMSGTLANLVNEYNLHDCVELLPTMTTNQVRDYMERSQIYLFTSDSGEGWGAVLNESMNSACAVVAGEKIGSVPYLIKDGENGLIFRDKNLADLTERVTYLLANPAKISELGRAAYKTISEEWSPKIAAERFIKLADALQREKKPVDLFSEGPCSKAELLPDDWYTRK
ncbi:MAG: glycosyltransferase [Synergistaceae bacterium]|nr:glycosyltransferase [Synergistaceae bacterium]